MSGAFSYIIDDFRQTFDPQASDKDVRTGTTAIFIVISLIH